MGSEPSVRRVVFALVAGVFLGGVGGGVAFPTLPALGTILAISPFVVGLILSLNRATRLVLNTPAGAILDRRGTRRPMIFGFAVQGLAPFGYVLGLHVPAGTAVVVPQIGAVSNAAVVFLASRALWGVGSAFVFVGAFATITHVTTPENRGTWVGYMRGGQSLGFPSGLVVGGLVTDAFGYDVAFAVAGVAASSAAVAAFFVLPDLRPDVETPEGLRAIPGIVASDPRIASVGVVNFALRFVFAGVLLSTVVLYADTHGIEVSVLSATGVSGLVMAASVVAASITTIVVGRLSDDLPNRALVTLPALAVGVVGFVALAVWPVLVGVLVGVVCIGVGVGGTNPPLLAYLGDISPEDDLGKLGGVYNVFGDLGSTLGPLVALPLAAVVGLRTEYLLCAALVGLVAVLVTATLLGSSTTETAAVRADDRRAN